LSRTPPPRAAARAVLLAALLLTAGAPAALRPAWAGDEPAAPAAGGGDAGKDDARDTSRIPPPGAPHLRYRRSYAEALRVARLRNLPVFVSRHKDF
jgi:hypothetical protein